MVTDPMLMCELLVGLHEVTVLRLEDEVGAPFSIHVETRARGPGCPECGARPGERPSDPLYRCRRLLTKADERIDEKGKEKAPRAPGSRRSPRRGDYHLACQRRRPRARHPHDPELALEWLERLCDAGPADGSAGPRR
jgi:hypothetical protein